MEAIADQVVVFTLVFIRMTGLVLFFPFFGEARLPVQLKGGLALLLAALVYGSAADPGAGAGGRRTPSRASGMPAYASPADDARSATLTAACSSRSMPPAARPGSAILGSLPGLAAAAALELGVGLVLGLAVQLLFSGLQLAGQLVGRDMGFAIVNVIDPVTSRDVGLLAQFKLLLAVVVMLAVNGHHLVIRALAESYRHVPVLGLCVDADAVEYLLGLGGMLFVTAIQIAAPILATVFLVTVALGFLGKTVPQMNIFIVGFPLRIGLGLAGLCLVLPFAVRKAAQFAGAGEGGLGEHLWSLLQALGSS